MPTPALLYRSQTHPISLAARDVTDQARLALVQLKLAHGTASALDVLEAERSVLADQQALVLVHAALQQNQIALYKALGGGLEPAP
jgi:multidrug efflux system outer membrane protein